MSSPQPPSYDPNQAQQPQQSYQPQGYAQQGYVQPQKTNTLAIVALISSFFVSLAGIICGHIALSQIKRTGEGGRGMAIAGLIIGYIGLVATIFWIIAAVAFAGTMASYSTY